MSEEKTEAQKDRDAMLKRIAHQEKVLGDASIFVFAKQMVDAGVRKFTLGDMVIELDESAFTPRPAVQPAFVYPAAQGPGPQSFTTTVGVPPGVTTMASGCAGTFSVPHFILP